jgi:integrase
MASEPLTKDEAKRLIDAIGFGFAGIRDRAYLAILYRCGLRNNECRMLDIQDIRTDLEPWTLRVRSPKGVARGVKPRELGIDKGVRGHLEVWLRVRGLAAGPLFQTRCGNRVDTSHFRRKVKVLAKSAGIIRRVHPHALRHTFARTLNDEGVSVRLIQLGLGHSNLNTTATYLQSLGDPEVIDLTSKREW